MASLTCLPDKYLNEDQLTNLFRDFSDSIAIEQSPTAIFSSLVNNVRHVYMAGCPGLRFPSAIESRELGRVFVTLGEHVVFGSEERGEVISWPAETFTLHIGSTSSVCRRDVASWDSYYCDKSWVQRLDFKVLKFEEPGTIPIYVAEQQSPLRIMVHDGRWIGEGWKHRLQFHAFPEQRPGTQMIWVAFQADPDTCIFVKGGIEDTLNGWERRLQFWVPK